MNLVYEQTMLVIAQTVTYYNVESINTIYYMYTCNNM